MSRVPRRAEPRITNLSTHTVDPVCLTVAATYLGMDRRALNLYIAEGKFNVVWKGRRRKAHLAEIARFDAWNKHRIAS